MDNQTFLEQLKRHEGVVYHAYQDHLGYWTIGAGRLIDKRKGGRLRPDEVDYLLQNDVDYFVREVQKNLPWWEALDPVRKSVLVNMAFNMGIKGLLGFKNTLKFIESGQYDKAADNMLMSKWATQVGREPPSRRQPNGGRAWELANMMRTGRYEPR